MKNVEFDEYKNIKGFLCTVESDEDPDEYILLDPIFDFYTPDELFAHYVREIWEELWEEKCAESDEEEEA